MLYVIDISNPRLPTLKSAMPNGFIETGVPGIFGLPEPQEPGIGHTASCIQNCRFAYLAGTARGIQIVDLRDPANPRKAGQFVPAITGLATHDVQVDRKGLAWIAGADGTAAYDVSRPLKPRMVMRTDESIKNSGQLGLPGPDPVFGLGGEGETPIDLIHHNSLHYSKRLVARSPRRTTTAPPARAPARSRPGGSRGRSSPCSTCSPPSSTTWSRGRAGRRSLASARPTTSTSAADSSRSAGTRRARASWTCATRLASARSATGCRRRARPGPCYFPPTDRSGEIVYSLDFARGIDVLRFDRGDRRVRRAPVRRSWLRDRPGSPGTGGGRTSLTRKTDFGFVCRLPSRRNATAPKPELPGIELPELPALP